MFHVHVHVPIWGPLGWNTSFLLHFCSLNFLPPGYSGMDYDSAMYILTKIVKKFISVIHEEALCIPEGDGKHLPLLFNFIL